MAFAAHLTRRELGLAGAGWLLSGCAGGSSPARRDPGTVTIATADDVRSLDPLQAFDTWSTAVVHACTRRLVDYDQHGELVPDLARRWTISPDGTHYTFYLRPGTRFADGSPLDARHFQAALDRVRDEATASPGASFYAGIERIAAPEPRVLKLWLTGPDPTLLNALGMTFAAPWRSGTPEGRPAESGPYRVERYEPGTGVVLTRSALAPGPGARTLELQLQIEEPLQLARFRAGEVDLLPAIPPAEYARVMENPVERARVVQSVVNQTWYFGMNLTAPPWDHPRVRQAALLALDRNRSALLSSSGKPANGILPPFVPGYDADRRLPERDLAGARRLVAEAGYPGGLPERLRTTMWLPNNDQAQRQAESIQADLRDAGIPVALRPVTLSEYLSGYRTHAACWYGGWYPDFPDAGNFLEPVLHGRNIRPGKSPNAARYRDPRVDRLLDRARVTPRGIAREALYREAETRILEDLPWIPLYFEAETRYPRPGVRGVVVHPVWRQMLTGIYREG